MSDTIISVERISKKYKLGEIGPGSLREAVERMWHRFRGRDPAEHMGVVGEAPVRKAETGNLKPEMGVMGEAPVISKQLSVNGEQQKESSLPGPASILPAYPSPAREPGQAGLRSQVSDISSSELWALRDVSFEVKRGEVLGIIGRNGAGKSTLLKILSRITEPTSGRAVMRGRVGSLLEVGTGFHPELTGRENIFLNGAILGMRKKEIESKFDEIVAFAEVEKFIDTPVKRYSSGMYVRLAFAVAAHLDPEILIVDEVLAVGDAAFQKKCLGKMSDVATREGRTVLFVSHNMGAITRLCGKTLLLDGGCLEMCAGTDAVISHYLSSDTVSDGERVWEKGLSNPGINEFAFKAVRIINSENKVSSYLDVRFPFSIEMEYAVKRPVLSFQMAISVTTVEGSVVFQSFDCDKNESARVKKPGSYISRCRIPGNFLNSGQYLVVIYADIRNEKILGMCENALDFTIQNTEALGPYDVRHGYVRPVLEWDHMEV